MITLNSGDEIPAHTNSILKTHMWLTRFGYNNNNKNRHTPFLYIIIYIYNTEACLPFYPPLQPSFKPLGFLLRTCRIVGGGGGGEDGVPLQRRSYIIYASLLISASSSESHLRVRAHVPGGRWRVYI